MSRCIPLLLSLLVLAGCASKVHTVRAPVSWGFVGKLAINSGTTNRVVSVDWRQTGDTSDIKLTGPLGIPVAEISAMGYQVQVKTDAGMQTFRDDMRLQLSGGSELSLPWPELANWVRGRSASGQVIDKAGISQDGWWIQVRESGPDGPQLILFEHPQGKLRLKIQRWQNGG